MSTTVALYDTPPNPTFNMSTYMRTLDQQALGEQQALAAAYDRACASLIGPNDVQQEGGRTFKKKSAWRKLARYFNITVEASLADTRIDMLPSGEWIAIARASAVAPWGQRFDDLGACGSDEETGRRTITYADAVATALTRAANRAVSNLIAMGEVSAEEIAQRRGSAREAEAPASNGHGTAPNGTPECPVCGGPMWDNRPQKQKGEFLNSPDLKCKDKACEGRYTTYPPVEGEKRANPSGPKRASTKSSASSRSAVGTASGAPDEPPPPDDGLPF